jgi:hypothetical protein
MEKEEAWLE